MATLQQIFPAIKDKNGDSIYCQCGCRRVARHIHHIIPRCKGGTDHPNNLLFVCNRCHTKIHSEAGDFKRWGQQGGYITAANLSGFRNLVQFRGADGEKRFEAWLNKRANQQMGMQYV